MRLQALIAQALKNTCPDAIFVLFALGPGFKRTEGYSRWRITPIERNGVIDDSKTVDIHACGIWMAGPAVGGPAGF